MPEPIRDHWAQWVLHRRHGGDAAQQQSTLEYLLPVRDRILQNAKIAADDIVLDVGTGDGLIAFGALDQLGERGRVILSDISPDCIAYCQDLVQELGVAERCQLLCAPADDLTALAVASVDVITLRSVLIFVAGKEGVFQEFYRILKPNGRLSIFEPINRYFGIPGPPGYDITPIQDIWHKILAVYERLQPAHANPMVDFDERDLLSMAERTGFREAHLELQVRVMPLPPLRWDVWVRSSPHPLLPTLEEAMHEALTVEEMARCATHLQPLMERGQGTWRDAVAYLWAVKG